MSDMSHLSQETPINLEELRERLRKMSDDALRHWGKCAVFLCTLEANHGKAPREVFLIQLEEARAEWKRRHPKT
jgi:hypothetical protein